MVWSQGALASPHSGRKPGSLIPGLCLLQAEGITPLDKVSNSTVLLMLRDALTSHQPLVYMGSKLPFIISIFLHPTSR